MWRRSTFFVTACAAAWFVAAPAFAAAPPDTGGVASPTTSSTLPPGCTLPDPAVAVFVGEVTAKDVRTARFEVVQMRAGSLKGFEVTGLVDVDYFDDVKYLEIGEQYIVGAGRAGTTAKRLVSTVREPAPLFGGNQVVGVDDSDVDCPDVEEPVRTLMLDGQSVESGVLTPMLNDTGGLLRAVLVPAMWGFVFLVAVAAVKNLLATAASETRLLMRRGSPLATPAPRRTHSRKRAPAPQRGARSHRS